MDKSVTASRLIYGLISEAEARGAIVFCRTVESGDRAVTAQLNLIQGSSFKDSSVSLSTVLAQEVDCEVVLFGRRLIFKLKATGRNVGGQYPLPDCIQLLDLRESPRIALTGDAFPAEIRFLGGIILGVAQDISRNHVSIAFSAESALNLSNSQNACEVVIRARDGSDIYRAERARLVQVIEHKDLSHAVFQWQSLDVQGFARKAQRHPVGATAIAFFCDGIKDPQISGRIELIEASLTGFSGVIRVKNSKQQPPLGLLLQSSDPNINFSATRKQGDVYGFVILSSNQTNSLRSWINFVDQFRNLSNSQFVSTHELAALLIESGFLKSKRLKAFGGHPETHLSNVLSSNPMLARRYAQSNNESHLSESLSVFRLTEYSWILHEVASGIHASGNMDALYESVISTLKDEAVSSHNSPRWLCVYYNPNLPVVAKKWDVFSERGVSYYFSTSLVSLSQMEILKRKDAEIESTAVSAVNRSDKIVVAPLFPEITLELIDFWTTGIPNLQLLRHLQERGPSHEVVTELIHVKDNVSGALACCHRIKTHYGVNSTGVLNSAWVFLKIGITLDECQDVLVHLGTASAVCRGTDDVILVFASMDDALRCSFGDSRQFRLLVTSLRELREVTS